MVLHDLINRQPENRFAPFCLVPGWFLETWQAKSSGQVQAGESESECFVFHRLTLNFKRSPKLRANFTPKPGDLGSNTFAFRREASVLMEPWSGNWQVRRNHTAI